MKTKFIYEALAANVFRPKSLNDIRASIESQGEPEFDYWINFVDEFNNLLAGKLKSFIRNWEYNEEKQYRAIILDTFIGDFKFIIDWHISKTTPNISIDIGTSTRNFLGPMVISDSPKQFAAEVLEKIREQNQAKPRPAHSFKRKNEQL